MGPGVLKTKSLKVRLFGLAALLISLILILAGLGFHWLFQRHVETFVLEELNAHFEQLASGLSVGPRGKLSASTKLSDPRFEQPYGGLYWQVNAVGHRPLRSRSLWDEAIKLPIQPDSEIEGQPHILPLPFGGEIFALQRIVVLKAPEGKEKKLVVTVGLDRQRVTTVAAQFAQEITWGLAAVYAALLIGTASIILFGLQPLKSLKRGVAAMRNGAGQLDANAYPMEVLSLVEEVNALANARERQLDRARQRASNLAHGLKTSLTVLSAVAEDLKSTRQKDASETISTSTTQMRGLVDRELARSRMSDGGMGYKAELAYVTNRVVATMKRAPRGGKLNWILDFPISPMVAMDTVDLTELLGNLTDNARKHAKSMVRIAHDGEWLSIEDDGKGVAPEKMADIVKRGVRLDQSAQGSGIGLAIVTDLVEVYDLEIRVSASDRGGLCIRIRLPIIAGH